MSIRNVETPLSERMRHGAPLEEISGWLIKKTNMMVKKKRFYSLESLVLKCAKSQDNSEIVFKESVDGALITGDSKKLQITISFRERKEKEVIIANTKEEYDMWYEGLIKSSKNHIEEYYELGKLLGEGAFAKVIHGVDKETLEQFAVKIISKENSDPQETEFVHRELNIMRTVDHPNVVTTYDIFDSDKYLYLVMEYMPGGTLSDVFKQRGKPTEDEVREVIQDILRGLAYLHSKGIVHRDLKLKNILCKTAEPGKPLECKLADFGLSNFVGARTKSRIALASQVGSPHYVAPEVLREQRYGPAVDVWSVGVIMHILLTGKYPFSGETIQHTLELVVRAKVDLSGEEWDSVSPEAKYMLSGLMRENPKERLTAEKALSHTWILGSTS